MNAVALAPLETHLRVAIAEADDIADDAVDGYAAGVREDLGEPTCVDYVVGEFICYQSDGSRKFSRKK